MAKPIGWYVTQHEPNKWCHPSGATVVLSEEGTFLFAMRPSGDFKTFALKDHGNDQAKCEKAARDWAVRTHHARKNPAAAVVAAMRIKRKNPARDRMLDAEPSLSDEAEWNRWYGRLSPAQRKARVQRTKRAAKAKARKNPPKWVPKADAAKWRRAEELVKAEYGTVQGKYGVVTHIYKALGGKVGAAKKARRRK